MKIYRSALIASAGFAMVVLAACGTDASNSGKNTSTVATETAAMQASNSAQPAKLNPYAYLPQVSTFSLQSETLKDGNPLPKAQMSGIFKVPGGTDTSPQLSWSGFPKETKSFVVSMYDPQAPTGSGFWHWVVADLPASTTSLPANAGIPTGGGLPVGALQLKDDAGVPRYVGGAIPAGSGTHNFYFTVTALDVPKSGVDATATPALLGFTIGSHTIARATLVCPTVG
ncbi:YbhB/YbcL family Raf kinase inhibitor-like protein [Lentzea sp. NPDC006480]|uniref:YbhB/YbcL family Raf kinase inhibitor-like protein n=1 Tax=Lentzea sp. NPDC006480 TaxID=3157176 RepID=UPI0033B2869D